MGDNVLAFLLIATVIPRRSVSRELLAEATSRDSMQTVQVTTVHRAQAGSSLSLPSTIQPLHESAIYARVGDAFAWLCVVALLAITVRRFVVRPRSISS